MTWTVGRLAKGSVITPPGGTLPPPVTPTPVTYTVYPTQAHTLVYEDVSVAAKVNQYARPGALLTVGRYNYADASIVAAANAGATVLIYLDAIIDSKVGRYHDKLINASEFGAAVPRWPGDYQANSYGYLNDFRDVGGSVMHGPCTGSSIPSWVDPSWSKLRAVLELMKRENPHMGGWFADDLGSRSYFPNFSWDTFGSTNQNAYRAGAIKVAQTFDDACQADGMVFCVNGTWNGGTVAANGGGYPDVTQTGCSLAPLFFIENHPAQAYATSTWAGAAQWGNDSITGGPAFPVVVVNNSTDYNAWLANGAAAFLALHSGNYNSVDAWGTGHATGLPNKVA